MYLAEVIENSLENFLKEIVQMGYENEEEFYEETGLWYGDVEKITYLPTNNGTKVDKDKLNFVKEDRVFFLCHGRVYGDMLEIYEYQNKFWVNSDELG